jgi:hypothetical protein
MRYEKKKSKPKWVSKTKNTLLAMAVNNILMYLNPPHLPTGFCPFCISAILQELHYRASILLGHNLTIVINQARRQWVS